MQLNIWGGKLGRQVCDFVATEDPDIICLQEVFNNGEKTIFIPDTLMNCYAQIRALGYEYSAWAPAISIMLGGHEVEFGNAIVSKFPLSDEESVFTAGDYVAKADVTQPYPNARNVQLATVLVGEQKFTIANHHGYWQTNPMGNEESIDSMKNVVAALRERQGPLIFTGDLNVIPASPVMRLFDGFLEDLTATHQIKDTLSSLGKVSGVPCDHILVSPEVQVEDFSVSDALVSDHRALLLTCSID